MGAPYTEQDFRGWFLGWRLGHHFARPQTICFVFSNYYGAYSEGLTRPGAGVTLNAVATALDITLRDASIQAEGDLDFCDTLSVSKEVPVGFQNIRLKIILDTDAMEEQLDTLLRLTERYCVVYQTLAHPTAMTVSRQRAAG